MASGIDPRPSEIVELERRIELINRFPDQNPNPVLRMTNDGLLIYANPVSAEIRAAWGAVVGERLSDATLGAIHTTLAAGADATFEVERGIHTFAILPVAVPEFEFINLYGRDITAAKVVARFPDRNPNPVFRVSADGVLLYANDASREITRSFGCDIGKPLPAEIHELIVRALDGSGSPSFVTETQGRTFQLFPVEIPEFAFINVYGTDITAARQVEAANRENERLLLNILPAPIADRLRAGEKLIADRFDDLTLAFADIVDFTALSSQLTADEVVNLLNTVFSLFDDLVDRHRLEKIKTIGDAYMLVGGLAEGDTDHTARVAMMALELTDALAGVTVAGGGIRFRIGIHRGPAVAGVIGFKKFIYDVWGDTVNVASRMESHGMPGRVQVTQAVVDRLDDAFVFEPRGFIEVKGKGQMPTWFLTGHRLPRRNARPARRGSASAGERA